MDAARSLALESFLARQAGANRVTIANRKLLTGGTIQENWLIRGDVSGGPYNGPLDVVLRTDARSGVAANHTRAEEFALLMTAFAAGVMVPEPLWLCEDPAVIGQPFFVMRRIGGVAAGYLLIKDGRYGGDRMRLAERLGMELARIHSIRPPRPDLAFLPWYEETPAIHSVWRLRTQLDAQPTPHPALEWGLRWLERHAPARGNIVLCHRDYRTGNYMVDEQGLTGILDWEFAGWSDPLEDLGWFCCKCWRFGAQDLEVGGIGQREDFYRGYEVASGRPLDRSQARYWEVMAHIAWAVIAMQQADRHISGEETSLLLALTGHIVPEVEYEILAMTETSDV